MKKDKANAMISQLLHEIEEEDIGISLLTTHYQDNAELNFFSEPQKGQVLTILKKLSEDSKKHKKWLEKIIESLSEARDAK